MALERDVDVAAGVTCLGGVHAMSVALCHHHETFPQVSKQRVMFFTLASCSSSSKSTH